MPCLANGERLFRLWVASYATDWRPARWNEAPPNATALELVEDVAYTAEEAALFLQGFNTSMLKDQRPIWAVAVPVAVRYDGDVQVGSSVRGFVFEDHSPEHAQP